MDTIQKAESLLRENHFKIIQTIEKDGELFHNNLITFESDSFGCIKAYQLLESNNIKVMSCALDISIVDGILELPCGKITFC